MATNDYHFVLATADGTPIHFDILTGERVTPPAPPQRTPGIRDGAVDRGG